MEKPAQSDVDQPELANASRRRFGKTGLAASGVILTLASRSALGHGICQSPSGFASGNVSSHGGGDTQIGEGCPPSYWRSHSNWPCNLGTRFSEVFPCSPHSPFANLTLAELLSPQHFDPDNICMYFVAAYLNAESGFTPFLSTHTIQTMFSEWETTGYYSPRPNVRWDAAQIVEYLTQTQQ